MASVPLPGMWDRQPAVTGGGRLLISEAAEGFIAGLVAIPC